MKACYRCGIEKDLSDFYRDSRKKDGRQPTCKECKKPWFKRYQESGKQAECVNRYQKTDKGRKTARSYLSQKRVKLVKAAQQAVHRAVRDGRLERQPCQECGGRPTEAHHPDYDQPLVVEWLCRNHHLEVHK